MKEEKKEVTEEFSRANIKNPWDKGLYKEWGFPYPPSPPEPIPLDTPQGYAPGVFRLIAAILAHCSYCHGWEGCYCGRTTIIRQLEKLVGVSECERLSREINSAGSRSRSSMTGTGGDAPTGGASAPAEPGK